MCFMCNIWLYLVYYEMLHSASPTSQWFIEDAGCHMGIPEHLLCTAEHSSLLPQALENITPSVLVPLSFVCYA